ncbi:MAG: hypothetical protein M1814_002732 [Vezdaea aestivalis]|nr:MAG: hypothetical protein M1814_002732 [Vezdaea aestivalis]
MTDAARNLPIDPKDKNTWCKAGFKAGTLFTAGHVLLHEFTHLDEVGRKAGLTPDPRTKDHGTNDAQSNAKTGRLQPLPLARKINQLYGQNPKRTDLPVVPEYNAESYAAAATGESY